MVEGQIDQIKLCGQMRRNFNNQNYATHLSWINQRKIRVRTSSDHKIDLFSLGEDGSKDANVGMDSLNYVDFVD